MSEINKTTNYDMFTFSEDNRARIDQQHVKNIENSIKSKNLLHLRPIIVDENMKVIDGQHRLIAAKNLKIEIYYKVDVSLKPKDVILMNISKPWNSVDYFNFYVKNNYLEYIKLKNFIEKNNLTFGVGFYIQGLTCRQGYQEFKKGDFKFKEEQSKHEIETCWEIINLIKKLNGSTNSLYTKSNRFWNSLLKLIRNDDFDKDRFLKNLSKMSDRCRAKVNGKEYLSMLVSIHNHRATNKIINVE